MPADYKSMGTPSDKKPLSGFVWLLGGLAIGLFVALLVYLDKQPDNSVSFSEAVQVELDKMKKKAATAKKADASSNKTAPRFNFYTILPEMEVFIPESELQSSGSGDSTGEYTIDGTGKSYILQAGSFINVDDADRLKASLALLGLEAYLQIVSVNNQRWHRVRTGPYNNTKDLYHSLSLLKQNGIKALPLEIKPN